MTSKNEQLEQAMAKVQELQEQADKEAFDTLEHARDTLESNLHLQVFEGTTQQTEFKGKKEDIYRIDLSVMCRFIDSVLSNKWFAVTPKASSKYVNIVKVQA